MKTRRFFAVGLVSAFLLAGAVGQDAIDGSGVIVGDPPVRVFGFEQKWKSEKYRRKEALFSIGDRQQRIDEVYQYIRSSAPGKPDRFKLGKGLVLIFEWEEKIAAFYFPNYSVPANSFKPLDVRKVHGGFRCDALQKNATDFVPVMKETPRILAEFWASRLLTHGRRME